MGKRTTTIIDTRTADQDHEVVSIEVGGGGKAVHRKTPCPECPWRRDAPIGAFPAEAFRISAGTAHDLADRVFGCHMSGSKQPATCAGFLLRGAEHNLTVRMNIFANAYDPTTVDDGELELYDGYRSMAIANGVMADDPAIAKCRGADELKGRSFD